MELLSIYAGCVAFSAKKDKIDELLNLVEETNSPSDGGSLVLQGLTDMDFSVCCNEVFQNLFYEACKNWNSNDFQVLFAQFRLLVTLAYLPVKVPPNDDNCLITILIYSKIAYVALLILLNQSFQ